MSLVAYGNSDSEEECENQDDSVSSSTTSQVLMKSKVSAADELVSSSSTKKVGEKVKISIPSLKEFEDDEVEPEPKKQKTYRGGSSLFSILPPPKYSGLSSTTGFKPYILTKSKETKPPPTKTAKKIDTEKKSTECKPDSSDDFDLDSLLSSEPHTETESETVSDSTTGLGAFFSTLPEPVSKSYVLPEEDDVVPVVQNYSSTSHEIPMEQDFQSTSSYEEPGISEPFQPSGSEASTEESLMNDEEFRKILGKRGREEIQLIDVKGEDQLTGKDQWLMKSLTEEQTQRPSKRKQGWPTQQQKRKHQITYLAYQAKERELDLKNQWASNSKTRRETQAKYGF